MAKRPVFIVKSLYPFYEMVEIEFEYFSGFAISQKQKSIKSLHASFENVFPEKIILEISTKSTENLGSSLSAFNLEINHGGEKINLECAFQGSKVFEKGGPFFDIYNMQPWEAKKDMRLKESGDLVKFVFGGEIFCCEPKDLFYNWIYINALIGISGKIDQISKYEAFTDIEFNPKKSINCQAKAAAIACGLYKAGLLSESMIDSKHFLKNVYQQDDFEEYERYEQMSIFTIAM